MRLITHIFMADLRKFVWAIAAWTGLTAAAAVLTALAPRLAVDTERWPFFALSAVLLSVARLLVAASIITLIVQTHSTVGTSAFWLTRPIPRGQLFLSKIALTLSVVSGIPALADLAVMWAFDVPAPEMATTVAEGFVVRSLGVMVVMVVAALTVTLAQFAFVSGVLLAGAAVVPLVLAAIAQWRSSGAVGLVTVVTSDVMLAVARRWPDPTPTVVAWIALLAASGTALYLQYRQRERLRSILAYAGGLVVATVAAVLWPWPLLHAQPEAPPWAAAEDGLRLFAPPMQALWFDDGGRRVDDAPRWHTSYAEVYVQGLADGWFANLQLLRGRLTYDGRTLHSSSSPAFVDAAVGPGAPPSKEAVLQTLLEVDVIRDRWWGLQGSRAPVLFVQHEDVPLNRTRGVYEGEYRVSLSKAERAGSLDLRPGEVFQERDYRLRIDGASFSEGGVRVSATISRTLTALGRRPHPEYAYFLKNGRTREAIEGQMRPITFDLWRPGPVMLGAYSPIGWPPGFLVDAYQIRFHREMPFNRPHPGAGAQEEQSQWMTNAEVVVVRISPGGDVNRSIVIPNAAVNGGSIVRTP